MAEPHERPILMSGPMVRAILADRKTVTRRVVKPQPAPNAPHDGGTTWVYRPKEGRHVPCGTVGHLTVAEKMGLLCPYGIPGDRLWVRERARVSLHRRPGHVRLTYEADGAYAVVPWPERLKPAPVGQCVPNGVHREGARIFLDVTGVRVERLQDISETGARAEGVDHELAFTEGLITRASDTRPPAVRWFNALWNRINGAGAWDANPWVWVVEFRRLEVPHG